MNPVGFGGQWGYYHDASGLYLLTHRYYDAQAGRFVSRDPVGYKGGLNLYGFVGNNPVNMMDPEGTDKLDVAQSILTGVGFIPVVGEFADVGGIGVSLFQRDYAGAGLSAVGLIPGLGDAALAAKGVRLAAKLRKAKRAVEAARRVSRDATPFERYGSEAEAVASKSANKLLARPGHEAGTNEKWIGEPGTVNPRTLGSRPRATHSHKMDIETDPSAIEWLRANATIKPNEPGRYGIPNAKLDEFNNLVKSINLKLW